jgi:hypothetical protein
MRRIFGRHSNSQRGPEVRTAGISEVLFVLPSLAAHIRNTSRVDDVLLRQLDTDRLDRCLWPLSVALFVSFLTLEKE